jgi:hypothetical protein
MKYYTLLLFSFLMFSATSQTKEKAGESKSKEQKNCKVKVNFASPGSGIDGKTYDAIIAMIKEEKLKYTTRNYGREGETELCLPLTDIKKAKKNDFIERLKKTAAAGQFVSVSVN